MSVLVTPDEMRAAEAAAVAAGVPEPELMRRAATGIANWIDTHVRRRATARRFVVALIGPGNNGGDALVALALLVDRGWRCGAILVGRREIGTLPAPAELLEKIEMVGQAVLGDADVVLDGVYGVGGRASLPPDIAALFARAHTIRIERGTPLVSIDVPSGVDAGTGAAAPDAFQADVTLCLGLPKIGLVTEPAASYVGELELLEIGIASPPAASRPTLLDDVSIRRTLPRRGASAHKHQTGAVLIIGGAPNYYGAPRLSAEAAARAGAGLVCVAVPATIVPVIATQVPEAILLPLDDSVERAAGQIIDWVEQRNGRLDAVVIGPGLGQTRHATEFLDRLLANQSEGLVSTSVTGDTHPSVVLDADALNWIAKRGGFPAGVGARSAVMTPHAGELSRLLNLPAASILGDPIHHARTAARQFDQTIILKSGYSVVASPDGSVGVAPRAMPELATAGTGDVLAGLVGGLLAQGLTPVDAARAAVYVGSQAGLRVRRWRGVLGAVARDVMDEIPTTLRRLGEPNWIGEEW